MAEQKKRQRRAHGEESRQKILDAATEIAAVRGYEGTSISEVVKRSGLPASSIYWHFADKDALLAAVIDRSFEQWLATISSIDLTALGEDQLRASAAAMAKSLIDSPDFLRIGLMVAMERRPDESAVRGRFLRAREQARSWLRAGLTRSFPDLDAAAIDELAIYAVAAADGLFIQRETEGDAVDLVRLFELHAVALEAMAAHLGREGRGLGPGGGDA